MLCYPKSDLLNPLICDGLSAAVQRGTGRGPVDGVTTATPLSVCDTET